MQRRFWAGVLIRLAVVAIVFRLTSRRSAPVKVEGLITVRSSFGHGETLARFETAIRANGMSVVARADNADGALEISVSPDATTLLMFGNRARQAELVNALRLIALELPFKVLIWQ